MVVGDQGARPLTYHKADVHAKAAAPRIKLVIREECGKNDCVPPFGAWANKNGLWGGRNMQNYIGDIIYESRQRDNLTQDQYGAMYNVSGPAIFKFENCYVRPSLELWLKMAANAELSQRRAVLLWVKSMLPEQFQEYIEMQAVAAAESETEKAKKKGAKPDYSKFENRDQMREILSKDTMLPKGLRELLDDDELWALYKPTGHEVNMLRDTFGPLGKGSKVSFREALRLIREFAHSF
jgi:DNA-binding XRE family transcriptional regulator